ncbi:MAG: hypothetical protein ACLGRW_05155, partial [Acidobacteriota bacterium]
NPQFPAGSKFRRGFRSHAGVSSDFILAHEQGRLRAQPVVLSGEFFMNLLSAPGHSQPSTSLPSW